MINSGAHDNLIPMKNTAEHSQGMREVVNFIALSGHRSREASSTNPRCFNGLRACSYNLYTGFPQKMWKTSCTRALLHAGIAILCLTLLSSCNFFKGSKKDQSPAADAKASGQQAAGKETDQKKAAKQKEETKAQKTRVALDNSLIDQGEDEVKKKFGEPDVVSKTTDNQIIWTYKPKWKIWPDNAGTVYVEFMNGKVAKIVRAVR